MNTEFNWYLGEKKDESLILALMKEFYDEDKITYHEERIRPGMIQAFENPSYGKIFLLKKSKNDQSAAGYMIITFGFSLEYGGRFLLLDELFIAKAARGQGWGRKSLDFAVEQARKEGILAVRLEVNTHNEKAKAIYLKYGFADEHRGMMTKFV